MKVIKVSVLSLILFFGTQNFAQIIGGNKGGTTVEVDEKAAFDAQIQKNREEARAALKPYKYDGTKTTTYSYKTYTFAKEVEVLTIENTDYMLSFNATSVTKEKIIVRIFDGPETAPGRILLYENTNVGGNSFVVRIDDLNQKFREERLKSFSSKPSTSSVKTVEVTLQPMPTPPSTAKMSKSDKAKAEAEYKAASAAVAKANADAKAKADAEAKAAADAEAKAKANAEANIAKMRLKKVYISYVIPAVDKEVQTDQVSKNKTVSTTVVTFNAIVVAVGYKTL